MLEIAQFFQGREIDGKTVYGAAIFTERGSEGITMGVTSALYPWGFKYENTPGEYDMEGAVNSPEAVEALEFYKEFYKTATPPGYTNSYMGESLDAFKSGQVAMAMNWFAFFPGLYADPNTGGEKIDFFVNPPQNQAGSTLGGQGISVVAYSDKQDAALEYIKWFANPDVQAKWWELGGYSAHNSVLNAPDFPDSAPFAGDFAEVYPRITDIDPCRDNLTPAIDHDQLLSISTEKVRYVEATPEGVDVRPLMGDHVPRTDDEVRDFKRRVQQSPNAREFFVSRDGTATLIQATFQDYIDYGVAFNFIRDLRDAADDESHDIYMAGQPILTGWVYELRTQTYQIFGVTLLMLVVALALYMRNLAGTLTPIVCSAVAAVWGFGLVGWLKSPIEPLLMIVPLLLVARSFSHCVQFGERFYEIYAHLKNKRKAAEVTMGVMMMPSILGVITDGLGIVFIAVAPISAMERFALFCGFWAFCIIPTGVFDRGALLVGMQAGLAKVGIDDTLCVDSEMTIAFVESVVKSAL